MQHGVEVQDVKGAHRSGSEWAALAVLTYAAAAWCLYCTAPNILTGGLLGLGGAWVGLTVQHCGNHGAMSTSPTINNLMGACSDLVGGSSLMWRYHHQVSHHVHANDDALDEDVFSSFPLLRFDPRLPRKPWHQFQHLYMWLTFPLMQIGFQFTDIKSLYANRTPGATLYGATDFEKQTVLLGKLAHFSLLWFIPMWLHGVAAVLPASLTYIVVQGVVLAATFAVSHNIPEAKTLYPGAEQSGAAV
jgi:acyl-lipid (7-3)-desaturase (Delta-4 desaturase)